VRARSTIPLLSALVALCAALPVGAAQQRLAVLEFELAPGAARR
jgi:hypothetical protein